MIHLATAARVGPAVCGTGRRRIVSKTWNGTQVTCPRCRRVIEASKAAAAALPRLGR